MMNSEYDTYIEKRPSDYTAETGSSSSEILSWMGYAACNSADPEAFFPKKGESTYSAKKVCKSCEVRTQCLDYALSNNERFGIWGGLSSGDRQRLQASRRSRPSL